MRLALICALHNSNNGNNNNNMIILLSAFNSPRLTENSRILP